MKKLRETFDHRWREALRKAIRAGVTTADQLFQLKKVFGDDWETVLDGIRGSKSGMGAKIIAANEAKLLSSILGGETMAVGYKATEELDLATLLDQAIARLQEVGEDQPAEVVRRVLTGLEELAQEERRCDEEKPKPKKRGRKAAAGDHPLARLAAGTPLGPPARPARARYIVNAATGIGQLVEAAGTKAASSRAHPLLARLGAVTTERMAEIRDEAQSGRKVVRDRPGPLSKEFAGPLAATSEDIEAAEQRYEQEESARKSIQEAARPAARFSHVCCPVCARSHRISKAGLQKTSRYCPQHGDVMQPVTSPGDTASARKSAACPSLPGGSGRFGTGSGY